MGSATALRSFTLDEYERMVETGILHEDERIELLGGQIVEMAPIGIRHAQCVDTLAELLVPRLIGRARVRVQNPIRIPPRSEPQPDLAVVRRTADNYRSRHPLPEDVLLLIEVADTSLEYDRDEKLPRYAEAGVPEVWIVDLLGEQVLLYRLPRNGRYEWTERVRRGGSLTPAAFPDLTLTADDVLG